jgi:transcriptional antiterminator RfaH
MSRWYVVHTQPQAEARALWHLRNQGFHCFLPRIVGLRRHARQVMRVLVPLFPRYFFVRFDLDVTSWRAINGSRGVVNLLTDGTRPLAAPVGAIESLVVKCDPQGVASLNVMGVFSAGRNVRIKSGAFAGQVGSITKILSEGSERVGVLLTLLGADTELQIPSYAIEAA